MSDHPSGLAHAAFRRPAAIHLVLIATLGLAACAQPAYRQDQFPSMAKQVDGRSQPSIETLPAFTLSPGDEFDLRVPDAPQLDQAAVRIRPDGSVSLPVIGTVQMEGRTVDAVQAELRLRMAQLAGEDGHREYLLHANDEIEIKFPFQPQWNETVRLRPDGKIQLQMAGPVQAEGLSPEALRGRLIALYGRWLRKPDLAVIVRSASSQNVRTASGLGRAGLRDLKPVIIVRNSLPQQIFVGGEVAKPGTLNYRPGISLVQAMVEAGGQLPTGDLSKLVILRRAADDSVEVIQGHMDAQLLRSPDRDILLRPFDVVLLPKSSVATLADNLNLYVFNLVPFIRNSSLGVTYNIRGYQQ